MNQRRFDQSAVKPVQPVKMTELPPGMNIERRTPIHPPTMQAQVVVPVARAIVTGALFLFLGWLLAYNWHWPKVVPFAAFLFGFAVVWFWKGLRDDLCYLVETATGRDINQDGDVGRPRESFEIVEVARGPYGDNLRMFDVPGEPEQFAQVCYKALTGTALTQDNFSGRDKLYTRGKWSEVCDEMVRREWWAWVNEDHHPSGIVPLPEGKRKMAQWLEQYGQHANTRTHAGVHVLEHMEQE